MVGPFNQQDFWLWYDSWRSASSANLSGRLDHLDTALLSWLSIMKIGKTGNWDDRILEGFQIENSVFGDWEFVISEAVVLMIWATGCPRRRPSQLFLMRIPLSPLPPSLSLSIRIKTYKARPTTYKGGNRHCWSREKVKILPKTRSW